MRSKELKPSEVYQKEIFPEESELYLKARHFAQALGLEGISLSPSEGRILKTFVAAAAPLKLLEIGTLTGLSALYLSSVLPPEACLWTLEKNPLHAQKAREIFAQRGGALNFPKIQLIEGDAQLSLESLKEIGPFDLLFIDGNKGAYGDYLKWGIENLRDGGLLIADNVFLQGAVWGEATEILWKPRQIECLREFNFKLANPNLFISSCLIPTEEGLFVGCKRPGASY